MRIARLCVDTGGRDTAAVYGHLRRLRDPRIAPTKGIDGWNRAQPVQGPTPVDALVNGQKLRRGLKLWTVSVSTWKADLYRRLWLGRGDAEEWPPGWVHLPRGDRGGVGQAARRRAAAHDEGPPRLRPAGMGQAAREERGAGLRRAGARRALAARRRPLRRAVLAAAAGAGRGRAAAAERAFPPAGMSLATTAVAAAPDTQRPRVMARAARGGWLR